MPKATIRVPGLKVAAGLQTARMARYRGQADLVTFG